MICEAKVNAQEIFAQGLDVSHLRRGKYDLSLIGTNYAYSKTISTR